MSRGQVLAEFALISVAALMIIFGIIDFGRAFYTYHLVSNAARLGTRYAIVRGSTSCTGATPDPLLSYVSGQAPGIDSSKMTVTTVCTNTPGLAHPCTSTAAPFSGAGCLVTVTVTYPFTFVIPLLSLSNILSHSPGTLLKPAMTSTSAMVISKQ